MSRVHLSTLMLAASLPSVALWGCGNSDPAAPGTGVVGASGGSETGGAVTTTTGGTAQVGAGGTTGRGGTTASGGSQDAGGTPGKGGATATGAGGSGTGGKSTAATGGSSTTGSGGTVTSGGATSAGGVITGGRAGSSGGAGAGGSNETGGKAAGGASAGQGGAGGGVTTGGAANTGTCTVSKAATGVNATGSGPHKVTVETNADTGIKEGTIYRPTDLAGTEKYPIFAWGEGGCSQDGKSNSVAMAEIASYGYFVIADGTPGGTGGRTQDTSNMTVMGQPLLAYITWAIAENDKPCSAYYHSLDTTKIATNGFSCGGLMAEGTAGDARITTWGLNSSGLFSANQAFYKTIHTPVLLVLGGTSDMAYPNGSRDYDNISTLGVPVMFFSKDLGHGGDSFGSRGGDFTKINLAWLNWWLKGDVTATGKGVLVGSTCTYCTNSAWEVKSKNIP